MDNTYLHIPTVLLSVSSKQAIFVAFLLPKTCMSRRPLGCHTTTNNICQNTSKALWFNACHLIAIYKPVLPASERWKHCTLRQWSTTNKKKQIKTTNKRRAKICGYHRTGWSCHLHPCIFHPASAEHLSISCHHVHWLFVSFNSCSWVCHIQQPAKHRTLERKEKHCNSPSLSHVSDTSYSHPVFLESVFHPLPFSARENSSRPALLCQDAIQCLVTDTAWSTHIVNRSLLCSQ